MCTYKQRTVSSYHRNELHYQQYTIANHRFFSEISLLRTPTATANKRATSLPSSSRPRFHLWFYSDSISQIDAYIKAVWSVLFQSFNRPVPVSVQSSGSMICYAIVSFWQLTEMLQRPTYEHLCKDRFRFGAIRLRTERLSTSKRILLFILVTDGFRGVIFAFVNTTLKQLFSREFSVTNVFVVSCTLI